MLSYFTPFSVSIAVVLYPVLLNASPVADFALSDVNDASKRNQTRATNGVSPRNYQHVISAWYFGNEG